MNLAKTPWHMKLAIGYLVVAGLWNWIGTWAVFIFRRIPIAPNIKLFALLTGLALMSLLAAFALHKRKALVLLLIAVLPVLRVLSYAALFPDFFQINDFVLDASYIRRLPPVLLIGLATDIALLVYCGRQWQRRSIS